MSRNYDNWERLVGAVLLREELRRLARCPSMEPSSISSESSRFSFSSSIATASPYDDRKLVYNELSLKFPAPSSDTRNDINWERFSPPNNYQEITDSMPASLNVFLDEQTGKKCYMIGARDLKISLASDASQYWKWRPRADSSFSEVAELQSNWRLDIRGKINTRILQPRNVYTAYLIFKISERAEGLESAKVVIRFVNDESDREAAKRSKSVHLQAVKETAMVKGDMEIEMGKFYVGKGEDETVEARLLSVRGWKTGLIVQGILFRPTYVYSDVPLVSKQCMQRNVWG